MLSGIVAIDVASEAVVGSCGQQSQALCMVSDEALVYGQVLCKGTHVVHQSKLD